MNTFMHSWVRRTYLALTASILLLVTGTVSSRTMPSLPVSGQAADLAAVQHKLGGMDIPFEPNQGQYDAQVAYVARTFAGALFITRDGRIVHSLPAPQQAKGSSENPPPASPAPGWVLTETLEGAAPLEPTAGLSASTRVSRIVGNQPAAWSHNVPTYQGVELGHAWPGVSVQLAARGSNVEKLFTVAPGAKADAIAVRIDGAQALRLGREGQLIAMTGNGEIAFTAPIAFQEKHGQRVNIPVRYELLGDKRYGFVLGDYDPTQSVVIDPLMQSTYLGGGALDRLFAMAVDSAGNILVAGYSASTNFPGTIGGAQPAIAGPQSGFVVRLSADLTRLVQATYLGGNGSDEISAMVLDGSDQVLVAGKSSSTNFPGTTGSAQQANAGGTDGFVARLSSDLTMLMHATYLGGSGTDGVNAMALDRAGRVLVAGETSSVNMPSTAGAAQPVSAGSTDGFAAVLSADLGTLVQTTYLGGGDFDQINALVVDSTGKVLVAGITRSTDLPGTAGSAQPAKGGGSQDGFLALLSGDLDSLVRTTYLGGSANDGAYAMALDSAGRVLVVGDTTSANFPGTAGGAQQAMYGSGNAFAALLSTDLNTLVQATYLGNTAVFCTEQARSVLVDDTGQILVAGVTCSPNFPSTAGGAQPLIGGVADGYVTRLSGNLRTIVQSTYVGGSATEYVYAMSLDSVGRVLVGGQTTSSNFPSTGGSVQPTLNGNYDTFVSMLSADLRSVSSQTINFPLQAPQHFSAGGTFAISPLATATSNLLVGYASRTPSVCTVSGTTVTIVAAGTCTVAANQPGNAGFTPATEVTQDITIMSLGDQVIDFPAQLDQSYLPGGSFSISPEATASSGLPVTYASTTPAVCTISGSIVSFVSTGTCIITADQAGDSMFNPAPQVSQSITIVAAILNDQTINFPMQGNQVYKANGSFSINPEATASSGLPVSYSSQTPAVCSVSGKIITMVALGNCNIAADQAGNASFSPAPQMVQSIAIQQATAAKAVPTLSQGMLVIMALLLICAAGVQRSRQL